MIKKLWLDTIPIFIIIAMFGYVLGVYFGLFQIPFLYKYTTYTDAQVWRFDTQAWLNNINGSFVGFEKLKLEKNPLDWVTTDANMLEGEFWEALVNNIAYMFNWVIYLFNVVLFVFRFIAYIIVNILCILGMVREPYWWNNPTTGQLIIYETNWLMDIFVWISNNLQIPFINP